MKLKFEAETEDGPVAFQGSLDREEVEFLLQYALIDLIRKGVIPMSEDKRSRLAPGTEVQQ